MASSAKTGKHRDRATSSPAKPAAKQPLSARWFWLVLLAIVVLGGAARFAVRAEYLAKNPLSSYLILDAATYWDWAGRIAGGEFVGSEPFFSAPLYPCLLGVLRAAGGGLPTVYSVQILLDLATAVLLAWIGRARFSATTGLLAAALFLLMTEPASYSLRVLSATVQLPLVCVAWMAMLAAARRRTLQWAVLAGASLGLLALSCAPALLCLPAFAIWWWWRAGRSLRAALPALLAMLAGMAVVSPASIYNCHACGEFIPISAQAGVTFAQGNSAAADGTYTPLPGVSRERATQNQDALRMYQQATGQPPSWRGVNRYFLGRGLDHWRAEPLAAFKLLATKAYWFVTGRQYGDVYVPTAEQTEGLLTRLRLAPLPTAWLILPALIAVLRWARRPGTYFPELLLFVLPLLVAVVFWYSPRYRFPAVPVIVVACAWGLAQVANLQTHGGWRVAVPVALLVGIVLGPINRAAGFDQAEPRQVHLYFALGRAAAADRRLGDAVAWYRRMLEVEPDYGIAAYNLGAALVMLGQPAAALPHLQHAVELDARDALAHNQLGRAVAANGRLDDALEHFRLAAELRPDSADMHHDLAVTLLRTGDADAALDELYLALDLDPGLASAHLYVARIRRERGDARSAIESLRRAQECAPQNNSITLELAWNLATLPGLSPEDRATALDLAQRLTGETSHPSADALDALAAALAACGRFEEAVVTIERALEFAERDGHQARVGALRHRLGLYRNGQPYVWRPARREP